MIIFHSPTCPGCKLQEPALEQALAENAKDVVFWKACVATHSAGDYLSCSREFADGAFAQDALTYVCGNDTKCAANIMLAACQDWNLSVCEQNALRARIKEVQEKNSYTIFGSQAMAMAGQYGVQATPTIVFNCYFKRQGALQQPYEEKLLNDMIQAFVKGA
jgi:predicted DsbA family dithiol-disulfide isomerase